MPGYAVSNTPSGLNPSTINTTKEIYDILGRGLPKVDVFLNCISFNEKKLQEIVNLAISSDKIGMVVINTPEHQSMLVFSNDNFYLVNELCV